MNLENVDYTLRQWGSWNPDRPDIRRLTGAYSSLSGRIIVDAVEQGGDLFQEVKGKEWVSEEEMRKVDAIYRGMKPPHQRLMWALYREGRKPRDIQTEFGFTRKFYYAAVDYLLRYVGERLD